MLCCKRLTVGKEWYQRHNAELQLSFLYMDGSCTRYLGPPQGSSAHAYVCGGEGGRRESGELYCFVQCRQLKVTKQILIPDQQLLKKIISGKLEP